VIELIPFVLAKAIIATIGDKFKEDLSMVVAENDTIKAENIVYMFVFELFNGATLSEQALVTLKNKFIDYRGKREVNSRII
jgi:hypothetical protein